MNSKPQPAAAYYFAAPIVSKRTSRTTAVHTSFAPDLQPPISSTNWQLQPHTNKQPYLQAQCLSANWWCVHSLFATLPLLQHTVL